VTRATKYYHLKCTNINFEDQRRRNRL